MASKFRYALGTPNPIDGVILTTANAAYFANFGDDGNPGDDQDPFASVSAAAATGKTYLIGNGIYYNEQVSLNKKIIGDGYLKFVSNINPKQIFDVTGSTQAFYYNVITDGYDRIAGVFGQTKYCTQLRSNSTKYYHTIADSAYRQYAVIELVADYNNSTNSLLSAISSYQTRSITIINRATLTLRSDGNAQNYLSDFILTNQGAGKTHVSNIGGATNTQYGLFITGDLIKIGSEANFIATTTIEDLRNRAVAQFGGLSEDYFQDCRVLPGTIFNDDYSLNTTAEGLIAATMASNFAFVGGKDIAFQWKPGAVDYLSTINLTLDNGRYRLTDTNLNGAGRSVIKSFDKVRELKRQFFEGVEAPLNGQVIDSTPDWGPQISPDSGNDYTGLTVGEYYTFSSGNGGTYNGKSLEVGQTFKVVSGVTTATDDDGTGTIRKLLETPNKKNIRWRFSKGGALTSNIAADRVDEDWMKVLAGSINDGTNTFNSGDIFKYDDGLTYSGTYQLQFIFNESEPWQEMEISGANHLSVDSAGRGNGDPNFDYASEIGIQAKYVQHEFVIEKENNRFLTS